MSNQQDPYQLPPDLPVPVDDGACDHLVRIKLPSVSLPATSGGFVDLSGLGGWLVIYCYPMTGQPGQPLPDGWDEIPGARGCTPQTCSFRDHYQELQELDTAVYGLSAQDTFYQREMVERLHVPFPVLSDARLEFAHALRLPTFTVGAMTLLKRATLVVRDGVIRQVFYPVFPPHRNSDDVIAWLKENRV